MFIATVDQQQMQTQRKVVHLKNSIMLQGFWRKKLEGRIWSSMNSWRVSTKQVRRSLTTHQVWWISQCLGLTLRKCQRVQTVLHYFDQQCKFECERNEAEKTWNYSIFRNMNVTDRYAGIRKQRLCYGCLVKGYAIRDCRVNSCCKDRCAMKKN